MVGAPGRRRRWSSCAGCSRNGSRRRWHRSRPDSIGWAQPPTRSRSRAFALSAAAAGLIAASHPFAAGLLYLLAGLLDLLDGVLARRTGRATRFGAFLDSTLDRASEGLVFAAIGYRLAADGSAVDAGIVVLALLGSFLVSYVRARAEGLGAECKVGIATRAERVVLVGAGLLAGRLAEAMHLVALLTAVTVVQRIARVRRALQAGDRRPQERTNP